MATERQNVKEWVGPRAADRGRIRHPSNVARDEGDHAEKVSTGGEEFVAAEEKFGEGERCNEAVLESIEIIWIDGAVTDRLGTHEQVESPKENHSHEGCDRGEREEEFLHYRQRCRSTTPKNTIEITNESNGKVNGTDAMGEVGEEAILSSKVSQTSTSTENVIERFSSLKIIKINNKGDAMKSNRSHWG